MTNRHFPAPQSVNHHHDHHHGDDPARAHAHSDRHRHDHAHGDHHHHHHAHGHDHHHEHGHDHDHVHGPLDNDAHARAHAAEIERRFASGKANNLQTVLFGLTGGLIPCSAAVTVLILCLNIGQVWLGIALVSAFSIGLAVTLVAVGVAAALGMRYVSRHSTWLDQLMDRAPYISSAIIVLIGVAMIVSGLHRG